MESSSDELRCNGSTVYSDPPGSTTAFVPVPEPSSEEGKPVRGISSVCLRQGLVAYNVASSRNRKDDRQDVKDVIAKERTADEIVSAADMTRIVDVVYKFGSLNNRTHMSAEIYYCSAGERNRSHLKPLDAAQESFELCQSIDRFRTHVLCVAYVLANKIP